MTDKQKTIKLLLYNISLLADYIEYDVWNADYYGKDDTYDKIIELQIRLDKLKRELDVEGLENE